MKRHFFQPQQTTNSQGQPRHVGFELEFAGIDLKTTGQVIAQTFNGELQLISEAEGKIKTDLGTFKIEIDWQFAKTTARERIAQRAQELGTTKADDPFMQWMAKLATIVVPVEVVCPPIAVNELDKLQPMVESLRNNGALGTGKSLIYAFGVHINPELPSNDSSMIIRYLKSFVLAQHWLIKRHKVDLIRRVTHYINVYPEPYSELVIGYQGDEPLSQIIDDYLAFNPTRNRALDMLPLFMYLDESRILSKLNDPLVNARPTLHYRLPNCEIEKPDWNLSQSWNIWCVVEAIAANPDLLAQMSQDWIVDDRLANRYSEKVWQQLDKIDNDLS
ncbi:amidoligase family protein [Celerinatantimonas sp. MCCC 1A17872]|uniref:amidoligase family protein n=1 Tax=Celerinatantimonas sp. MCCC 1A17872 TaxID=3177514 RepID=UPI0038C476BE